MKILKNLSKHHLFRNAGITASLSGAGVATGLLLDALILGTFGAGFQTDALFAALTLPTLLTGIFSIQCPKVFVPAFAAYFGKRNDSEAWNLLSNLLTVCTPLFAFVALLGMATSSMIMLVQIPGLDSKTISLGVDLSRILFALLLTQGISAVLQSALFARERYVVSSSGKVVSNLTTTLVLLFGRGHFTIRAVAVGMVLGSVFQIFSLFIALLTHGFRYRLSPKPMTDQVREILASFRFPLAGHILGESGTIVQNILGSFLGAGSITVMRYASRVVQAIASILLGSVVQVTLPLIARHAAQKDLPAQRRALLESMQLLAIIGLPICVWLTFTAKPLVALLFQRGQFSVENAVLTGLIIQFMVPDILLGRLVSVTQTLFYSNLDMRTPLISSIIFTVANTAFALILVRSLGVVGLPIAVSLASFSNAAYMLSKLHSRFGPIGWMDMSGFALRLAGACAILGAGLAAGVLVVTLGMSSYPVNKLVHFGVPTVLGTLAFLAGAFGFRLLDSRVLLPVASRP